MSENTHSAVAEAPASKSAEAIIDKFLDAIWMERGLSANTLGAYRADLVALRRWLAERDASLVYATRSDLLAFIAWRTEQGAKPRSTARQLSSFRRFYRFLLREGTIQEDPTIKIDMPRIGRSLPQSLTEAEVESLLAAPDVSDPLGHRDRTMLEVLYATGLRVSELINLKQSEINLNQGVLRVSGKGKADLNSDEVDYLVYAKLVGSIEGQQGGAAKDLVGLTIPVRIKGPFTGPKIDVKLDEMLKANIDLEKEQIKKEIEAQRKALEEQLNREKKALEESRQRELEKKLEVEKARAEKQLKEKMQKLFQ